MCPKAEPNIPYATCLGIKSIGIQEESQFCSELNRPRKKSCGAGWNKASLRAEEMLAQVVMKNLHKVENEQKEHSAGTMA